MPPPDSSPDRLITEFSAFTTQQCQRARLSRDNRFDGHFFTAVKTTKIFCRPICPANPPHERNVEYFATQAQALQAGYRPCLRCRPDSAPGSSAWKGVETTFQRAVRFIDGGELQDSSIDALASRLGISERYLRQLFQQYLGMPPKQYAQYQQLMFAKQLLHNSTMSISEVAFASGFNSLRRFNDAFQKKLKLTPRALRKASQGDDKDVTTPKQQLTLSYRPPFNWNHLLVFYRKRAIQGVEAVGDTFYQRTFTTRQCKGWFKVSLSNHNTLAVEFEIDDITQLQSIVAQIRRLFDLDADIAMIEQHLKQTAINPLMSEGLRIPGVWNPWEAGIRAIFGQQISITAAITLLNTLVATLNQGKTHTYFPTPQMIAHADLSFLKMPQTRKETLQRFARYMVAHPESAPDEWLALKGIGPWTVSYAKLRGLSQADCFLATDLVIKKAIATLHQTAHAPDIKTLSNTLSPWGSYATFNCWNSQS